MKYSRNPSTGQLEIYTDDGVYLGVMSTMGDVLEDENETIEDAWLGEDDDSDNGWRTTENGKHYQINENGTVVKGPKAMKGSNVNKPETWGTTGEESSKKSLIQQSHIEAASTAKNYVEFWMNLSEEEQKKYKNNIEALKRDFEEAKNSNESTAKEDVWKPANGTPDDFVREIGEVALPDDFPEIRIQQKEKETDTRQAHAEIDGVIEVIPENWDDMSDEAISGIIAHEAGHQLSNHDPKLANAILMNYGNVFGRYNTERHFFDGVYGQSSPEEAFAQCVS